MYNCKLKQIMITKRITWPVLGPVSLNEMSFRGFTFQDLKELNPKMQAMMLIED